MEILNEKSNLNDIVTNSKKIVVLYLSAQWCMPCKAFGPILETLASEITEKATFYKIDIDDNPHVAEEYNIRSVPTLVYMKDGLIVQTTVGLQSKTKILEIIEKL